MTPHRLLDVEVMIVPVLPTATNLPLEDDIMVLSSADVSSEMVKEVIVSVLLAFSAESVTIIVQSEYVPSFKETKVIVLFPLIADVVLEEQDPP